LNTVEVVKNSNPATLVSPIYLLPGTHKLVLTVTDSNGLSATDSVIITIKPYLDTRVGQKISVFAGTEHQHQDVDGNLIETIPMRAAVTSVNPIVYYKWTRIWPAGVFAEGSSASLLTTSFDLGIGVHTMKLEVTDSLGNVANDSIIIRVSGQQVQPQAANFPVIPSNFVISDYLNNVTNPPINNFLPDVVGAFRFICMPGHMGYDDPIVYPGQPGKAHLHQFFGNSETNAFSTYASLRQNGNGTCPGGPLNRSAYWAPAVLNGKGQVVVPNYLNIYYKTMPGTPRLPRGLRMVFGYNMSNPSLGHGGYYQCLEGPDMSKKQFFNELNCPPGTPITAIVATQTCWDGKNLDSPDHRSHMAAGTNNNTDGRSRCPITHPVLIPQFTMHISYNQQGAADTASWYFSSDMMMNADGSMTKLRGGTTLHGDWFGAWDETIMDQWMGNCINGMKNGADGNLCNGKMLKRPVGFSFTRVNYLEPIPVNQNGMTAH
jgi:hypothetical protein